MRQFFTLFFSLLLFVSCNSISLEVDKHTREKQKSHRVSISDVRAYLQEKMPGTKASAFSIDAIINDGDTVMFLVNYQCGWEVLSGDLRMPRVLMKSEQGTISLEELESINPYHAEYFTKLSNSIKAAIYSEDLASPEDFGDTWESSLIQPGFEQVFKVLIQSDTVNNSRKKNHLLSTKWGQSYPWNQRMPFIDSTRTNRCYAGCTMVATGQVLYYLHNKIGKPDNIYGNVWTSAYRQSDPLILSYHDLLRSNYGSGSWMLMPLDSTNSASYGAASYVSSLFLQLGYYLQAKYNHNGTGAHISNLNSILPQYYGLDCTVERLNNDSDRFALITENEILNNKPVISVHYYKDPDDEQFYNGHTIVIDGFFKEDIQITNTYAVYIVPDNMHFNPAFYPVSYYQTTQQHIDSKYVAINWGWDGSRNSTPSGEAIWYNVYDDWLVGYTFNYKYMVAYGFQRHN